MCIVGKVNAPTVAKFADVRPCGKKVCVREVLVSSVYVTWSCMTSRETAVIVT